MKHFFVWIRLPDGGIKLSGELATTEPSAGSGHFESEFQYAGEWASDPQSFALDPLSLPLEAVGRPFRAELFYPPLVSGY